MWDGSHMRVQQAGRGKAMQVHWQAVEAEPVKEAGWYSRGQATPGRQTDRCRGVHGGRQRRGNYKKVGKRGVAKTGKAR
jgi:hypothetical protein